jgi:hypothetical protein
MRCASWGFTSSYPEPSLRACPRPAARAIRTASARLRRELALLGLHHRVAERLHEIGRRVPVEVAATLLAARVLRARLRDVRELRTLLELGDHFLRLVLLLDQDVRDLVFLVAELRLDRVVFLADVGFGNRVRLDPVGDVRAHEHGLRRQVHLRLDFVLLVQALLLRLARQELARVELLAKRGAKLGRVRLPLRGAFLQHHVELRLRVQRLAFGGLGGRLLGLGRGRGLRQRGGRERERGHDGEREGRAIHRCVLSGEVKNSSGV